MASAFFSKGTLVPPVNSLHQSRSPRWHTYTVSPLTSIHSPKEPEGHIIAEDSRFEGLKINGEDVKVILRHDLLVKCKTFGDLAKGIAGDEKSGKKVALGKDRQVALCSLVEKIETKLKGVDGR